MMIYPPGPATFAVRQTWEWIRRPIELLERCRARYGDPFTLRFAGNRKFVILTDHDAIQQVFRAPPGLYLAGKGNENFKHFAGEHTLFALDGEPHRRHRRLLLPPFKGSRMKAYLPLMRQLMEAEVARWKVGEVVVLEDAARRVTLEIILRAVFGIEDPARIEEMTGLVARLSSRGTAVLAFMAPLRVDLGPRSPWGRFLEVQAAVNAILNAEITRARKAPEGRTDILARLIVEGEQRGEGLSDAELRSELITLLGAGHETTTAGLAWVCLRVLTEPGVLERCTAEARAVDDLTPEAVQGMAYIDRVIQETLRLNPPIPIVTRWLERPVELAGYRLPAKGTVVSPCIYLAQRDPARWPNPDRFDPERFNGKKFSPFDLFPFGGGARTCIGLGFALFEMKVMLATILRRVDLRLAERPSLAYRRQSVVLAPRTGTPARIERFV